MSVPSAGGISALALLAATTLPGLIDGRGDQRAGTARVAFRSGAGGVRSDKAAVARPALGPTVAPQNAAEAGTAPPAVASLAAAPAHPVAPPAQPATARAIARPAHVSSLSSSFHHAARTSLRATTRRHISVARDPADRHASGDVAHAHSGGAAPAAPRISAAAPRVPADPQPFGHPSTGGIAIHSDSRAAATPPRATTPSHPAPAHPVAKSDPVTASHPVAKSDPVSSPRPAPAPSPPPASGAYVNPLASARVTPERIDQGVDYSGSGTLGAIGDGKITYVGTSGTGWPGAFVEYRLTAGADAGRYVYYAESVTPAAGLHVGQTVRAGQPIASINGGIEIGWGSGVGTQPLAQALGQWSGGDDSSNSASPAGKSFSALIAQLGGPPGKVKG
jgi:hypothetical protein